MSLAVPYENVNDAQMRLQNTVVLYDGEPVYITRVSQVGPEDPKGDVFRVYAKPLPFAGRLPNGFDDEEKPEKNFRKFISSRKFDMAPFKMGFVNKEGHVYYCSRQARRQQRQGLSAQTFSAIPVTDPVNTPQPRFETVLVWPELVACIKEQYPTLEEATRMVEEGEALGAAFSRVFAIVRDNDLPELVYLYHKKEKVGFIMEGRLKLSKKGKCLTEALREVGVKC